MASSHYFYFTLPLNELDSLVENHKKDFNIFIEDTYSEEELLEFEKMIDSIAAIYVQPIMEELSFDDFYTETTQADRQKEFFENCRSSIVLENMPYLESNPFQVTYLKMLLSRFGEVLIDRGGIFELIFKDDYLKELKRFKCLDDLLPVFKPTEVRARTSLPVDPIDFLVLDVYKELDRLLLSQKLEEMEKVVREQNLKVQKLFYTLKKGKLDASELYQKSGLSPKDFDDYLEKIKLILRTL